MHELRIAEDLAAIVLEEAKMEVYRKSLMLISLSVR